MGKMVVRMGMIAAALLVLVVIGVLTVRAQAEDVVVTIPNVSATLGQEFTMTVTAESAVDVDGVWVTIEYDPTRVQVLQVTPTEDMPLTMKATISNLTGTVEYAGVVRPGTSPVTGIFDVVNLLVRPISATSGTEISGEPVESSGPSGELTLVVNPGVVRVLERPSISVDVALPLEIVRTLDHSGTVTVTIHADRITVESDGSNAEWR